MYVFHVRMYIREPGMAEHTDYTMVYRIAKAYYQGGLSQQQISKRENISRPHVSRMLAKARESGIVNIKVEMPCELSLANLQNELKSRLALEEVILVYASRERKSAPADLALDIATMAAEKLPALLSGTHTVGIGWGYTMYQTSLLLSQSGGPSPITFVPLIGISGENSPYLQISVIVNRFAEKFEAQSFYINTPFVRASSAVVAQGDRDRSARLKALWSSMDAAVVGLGPSFKEGGFLTGEAPGEYKQVIAESDLVGDILANYFDEGGSIFDSSAYYEHFSLPLPMLKSVKKVICLAGGQNKVDGIIAAAKNGFISTLITDNNTAAAILKKL